MKTISVSLILLALMGAGNVLVHAGEPIRPERPPGDRQREFMQIWNKVDSNRDGKISAAEFAGMPRVDKLPVDKRERLFERLDQNRDGVLAREEIHQLVKQRPRDGMPPIWELDKDQDGGVSFEEFCEGPVFQKFEPDKQQRIFSHLDSDGDGRITRKDKPQRRPFRPEPGGHPGPPPPEKWLERLDKDADGKVSWDEFRSSGPQDEAAREEPRRKRFEHLDRNRDGMLTIDEFKAMERPERRPPPGHRPPGGVDGREMPESMPAE